MKKHQTKAFTLVELIIVITILAILATIGFMSYQSYTIDARDGKRVADLGQIRKGLEIYQTKNAKLPIPDEQITNIVNGGNLLGYQGYAGTNVLTKIRADRVKDPKDNISYTYSTNGDYTKFQLMSMLENGNLVNISQTPVNTTYAANNYTDRKTYVIGNKLGVFLDNGTNAPIQETLSGNIDLGGAYSGTSFKVVFANTSANSGTIVGSGVSLYNNVVSIANTVATTVTIKVGEQTNPGLSCLDILNKGGSIGDGTYWIKPDTNPAFQVYCDMTTDGGGWTLLINNTSKFYINQLTSNVPSNSLEGILSNKNLLKLESGQVRIQGYYNSLLTSYYTTNTSLFNQVKNGGGTSVGAITWTASTGNQCASTPSGTYNVFDDSNHYYRFNTTAGSPSGIVGIFGTYMISCNVSFTSGGWNRIWLR